MHSTLAQMTTSNSALPCPYWGNQHQTLDVYASMTTKLTWNQTMDGAVTTERARAVWEGRKAHKRGRQHSPQSFSGYCCSFHFTTQYSAWPQRASAKDCAILVCVCGSGSEGASGKDTQTAGSNRERSREACRVCREPTEVSVFMGKKTLTASAVGTPCEGAVAVRHWMYSTKRALNNAQQLVCDSGQLEFCNMASNHFSNHLEE